MKFARQIKFEHVLSGSMMFGCLIMTFLLTGCGSSTPDLAELDKTPEGYFEQPKVLGTMDLVELAANNPMFDITDDRGLHYGTVALTAGQQMAQALPYCQSAIPGPMANCTPRGAKIVDGRLNMGVAEFGGETGLYYIEDKALCFSQMSTIAGCHRLAMRYDRILEVRTAAGAENLWVHVAEAG